MVCTKKPVFLWFFEKITYEERMQKDFFIANSQSTCKAEIDHSITKQIPEPKCGTSIMLYFMSRPRATITKTTFYVMCDASKWGREYTIDFADHC